MPPKTEIGLPDFSHIMESGRTLQTRVFYVEGLPTGMRPGIEMRQANENNPRYFNNLMEVIRRGSARRRPKITAQLVKQNRKTDRRLLAEYCAVSWTGMTNAKGEEVPFSIENCKEFLLALSDENFDIFRDEVADPASFREESDPDDVEAQAGN